MFRNAPPFVSRSRSHDLSAAEEIFDTGVLGHREIEDAGCARISSVRTSISNPEKMTVSLFSRLVTSTSTRKLKSRNLHKIRPARD